MFPLQLFCSPFVQLFCSRQLFCLHFVQFYCSRLDQLFFSQLYYYLPNFRQKGSYDISDNLPDNLPDNLSLSHFVSSFGLYYHYCR